MCGCIFALFAAFTPRLAFLFVWVFTPLVNQAFNTIIAPILGFIFLPFTTLIYVLVYSPTAGMTGWDWVWVVLALLIELSAYGGSAHANKEKIPYYPGTTEEVPAKTTSSSKKSSEKKEEE